MKNKIYALIDKGKSVSQQVLHQEINLAITGFSGAGKSSFITSLVNQLLYANKYQNLPFWRVIEEGRFVAASLDELSDRKIRRFEYAKNRSQLLDRHWPESTVNTSGLSLVIKYKVSNRLLASFRENLTLKLNIFDYPGEWLLDLMMLKQSYNEWRQYALKLLQQDPFLYQNWQQYLKENLEHQCDARQMSQYYAQSLAQLKEKGSLVSPGRFVLPGDLEGTPILEFFPLTEDVLSRKDEYIHELDQQLEQRFTEFKEQVIKPFFESYFQRIDRQILLVDCMALLKKERAEPKLMAEAIEELSSIFCYGESRFWHRLWRPRIDKVLFVATKADQIPTDQQYRLQKLVESLFYPTYNKLKFRETKVGFLTIASVKCTEPVIAEINGQSLNCIKGVLQESGESMVIYPGTLPESLTDIEENDFDLPEYQPPLLKNDAIPHIRMGKVLEFVTGDLLL